MDACEEAESDTVVVSIEVVGALAIALAIAGGVLYLRRTWATWYKTVMRQAFESIDLDGSGTVHSDELWAGVLYICLRFRQSNIPADPPEREQVKELYVMMDTDQDGLLNLQEFEMVMKFLSPQILGRAITLFVFILTWPALVGLGYNAVCDYLSTSAPWGSLPAVLRCSMGMLDDLHIGPVIGALAGFIFILPCLYECIDRKTKEVALAHAATTLKPVRSPNLFERVVKAVDPTPLLRGGSVSRLAASALGS